MSGLIEVTLRIRFNRACLGAVKRLKRIRERDQTVFCFARDCDDNILFLPQWWQTIATYAAKVLNAHQALVRETYWDPVVDAKPSREDYRHYYQRSPADRRRRFSVHEAFVPGDTIAVNAVIPEGMTIDDFWRIMETAGKYRGISPYRPDEQHGTFDVVQIVPRNRRILDGS